MKQGDFLSGKCSMSDLTRGQRKSWNKENAKRPLRMTEIPLAEIPFKRKLLKAWASRDFLAQAFDEITCLRLSVSRTEIKGDGRWADKITWEELQQVKRECGYGDFYAIEIYPQDRDIVNVANMRHLWILSNPLSIGWFATK